MGIDGPGGVVDGVKGKVTTLACSRAQSTPEHVSVGTRSTSKGCTCCRCAALLSLNMERESCGVLTQTEGGMG